MWYSEWNTGPPVVTKVSLLASKPAPLFGRIQKERNESVRIVVVNTGPLLTEFLKQRTQCLLLHLFFSGVREIAQQLEVLGLGPSLGLMVLEESLRFWAQ